MLYNAVNNMYPRARSSFTCLGILSEGDTKRHKVTQLSNSDYKSLAVMSPDKR